MRRWPAWAMLKRGWPVLALIAVPVIAGTQSFGQQAREVPAAPARTVENRLVTVDRRTIAAAIAQGRATIARQPGTRYVIRLPSGTFDLSGLEDTTGGGTIDVSRIDACPGELTIAGAGAARTTLILDDRLVGIIGRATRCVTIADLMMTQRRPEMSQGVVVSATRAETVIDVPRGFPTPRDLMPREREMGRDGTEIVRRWMKQFSVTPTGPQMIVEQQQAAWEGATPVAGSPNRWRIAMKVRPNMPTYRPGDLIGLKSKSGRDAYRFVDGDRITFRGVRWSVETRGVFHRVNRVRIEECAIVRPAPIDGVRWAMASSSGGPQIGQPNGALTEGHVVVNNDFQATGDDALLFANANGVVRGNRISDTFGSAIRIFGSPGLTLSDNVFVRAPIVRVAAGWERRTNPNLLPRAQGLREAANDNDND